MDFLCGVLLGSYKPDTLDVRWAKRMVAGGGWVLDVQVGRTAPRAFEWNSSLSSSLAPRPCGVVPRAAS